MRRKAERQKKTGSECDQNGAKVRTPESQWHRLPSFSVSNLIIRSSMPKGS